MGCDCYRIGGPFIAEDPDCPIHGREAQEHEKWERAEREEREEAHTELVSRITSLEDEVRALRRLVEQLVEKNS